MKIRGWGLFLVVGVIIAASVGGVVMDDGPDADVVAEAMSAFSEHSVSVSLRSKLILIDYDRSFLRKRLWLIDVESGAVEMSARVSHAFNSGVFTATAFSNVPESRKSSLGSFVTGESYQGKYGYSMRTEGLDRGVNHNARTRAIVFHQGPPVYSYGCFVTMPGVNEELINLTSGGTFVYVHKSGAR